MEDFGNFESDAYFQINDRSSAIEAEEALGGFRRTLDPEVELLKAILEDGINALRHRRADVRHDAWSWFRSDDESYIFSFVSVCAALNLSPSATRAKVLSGGAQPREYKKTDPYWHVKKRGKHKNNSEYAKCGVPRGRRSVYV